MAQVLVAMSGGVDSAVAAALLVEDGHDVTGVHLKLADLPETEQIPGQGCCTLDDAQDARRTAQVLDVPFYVWDFSDTFRDEVQNRFAATYALGATPNPCISCNEKVKYAALLDRAVALGFDAIATGHHARLERGGEPVVEPGAGAQLMRGHDRAKDQSYVLYMATAEQLAHTLLPVGEHSKDAVRRKAGDLGLRVAAKRDSYDVCFIPDGDTAGYLSSRLPVRAGPVVDLDGRQVGTHQGVWHYTVGQRRGLNIDPTTSRGGSPLPQFVVNLDADSSTVVVGPREALACWWLEVEEPTWTVPQGGSALPSRPAVGDTVRVQVRAHAPSVGAQVMSVQPLRLQCAAPIHGLALGQSAVVYAADDMHCLGGGRVSAADRPVGVATAAV